EFVGVVQSYNEQDKTAVIEQRNRILKGDYIEIMQPNGKDIAFIADEMRDIEGNLIESAPHPQMTLTMKVPEPVEVNSMLRKKLFD
ncbi:MAG: U32 family peptidase C-terminal domain-containing protein, partial [Ruminiclostridium sp.]|nr:U32 family peptidase C-terminal domain-containing protein [Ruminiclostridium sp.]